MELIVQSSDGQGNTSLNGSVEIPASKSHTIRAVVIGSLADGSSEIINPLHSSDTLSAVQVCQGLGAGITPASNWIVHGTGGRVITPDDVLDVGNSGTTLYLTLAMAALGDGYAVFTGDSQTRRRTAQALIDSLNELGAHVFSTRGDSCPPIVVRGRMKGGEVTIDGSKTSQYISSLLISCPLADNDTKIRVMNVTEKPYIQMTMNWLDEQGIEYSHEGMDYFYIKGGQGYRHFKKRMPGDFSSATFFLCAGAITDADITLLGLDMNDSQGDKAVVDMLSSMGAEINIIPDGIRIRNKQLHGAEFDLSATPDALPAMAVVGCFAKGETRLVNVPQARLKETDRISVMCRELSLMGARIRELPDGLVIEESLLHGTHVHGHGDHRVVMALSVAGLAAKGQTVIDTAESMQITFPKFAQLMQQIGGRISPMGLI
ncbi:MAG: 3-phosphoshikimate 1-carboxyvinyltransferase [bacterium]|nr:3-phosphoshikimate 1-carboxyvinyltransferase [bacterium]